MSEYNFYQSQLTVLAAFCVFAVLIERRSASKSGNSTHGRSPSVAVNAAESGSNGSSSFRGRASAGSALARQYLVVYGLVMCADWLQGPYVYSLYHEQYHFPERVVASLFVTGFLSAGLTAPIVGAWADQYGRRRVCLAFCVTYALACVCTFFRALPILYVGRVLGGISTSILFSAFESWLISSSNNQGLDQGELGSIFGRATLVNGFVAFSAGIASNKLVGTFSTFTAPFIASGLLLVLSYIVIRSLWSENYGNGGGASEVYSDPLQLKRLGHAWSIVRNDSTLLTLGLTQTCFEGSMYLFVFAWVPSLQEASAPGEVLPLGYIFSAFMVSMMLGSLFYTGISSTASSSGVNNTTNLKEAPATDNTLTLHAKLSSLVCTLGGLSLAASVTSSDVRVRFWAFCLFEACVGVYYPVQGMLRGALVSDDHRATLSSLFRVPLNVFVVFTLMTGVSSARLYVFSGCAFALAVSAILTGLVILPRTEENATQTLRSA